MITLKQNFDQTFLIYRTHCAGFDSLVLRHAITDKATELVYELSKASNAFVVGLVTAQDLSGHAGTNTLQALQDGVVVYQEMLFLKDDI